MSLPLVLALSLTAWSAWPSAPFLELSFLLPPLSSLESPEEEAVAVAWSVTSEVVLAVKLPLVVDRLRAISTEVLSICTPTEIEAPTPTLMPAAFASVVVWYSLVCAAVTDRSPLARMSEPVPM